MEFAILRGGAAVVLTLAGVIIAGAHKLRRFEGYELVVAAAILAVLPWSAHIVIGVPAAIWTSRVLSRAEVRAAFVANLRRKQRRPGSSILTTAGGEPPRPTGPVRRRVRSFLRSLRSVFLGSRS
jgi:hypothetical protein